jgi:hypothetical protein
MLKKVKLQLSVFSFSCLLMVEYGFTPATHAQFQNHQAPKSLKSKQVYPCIKIDRITNRYTPPLLYIFMNSCIKEGKYAGAVQFFALAGTYSSYDTKRVADITARQAHSALLQEFFAVLNKKQLDRLFKELDKTLSDKNKLPIVCTKIKSIGAPDYYPEYMINHGLRAVTGQNKADSEQPTGNGLITDFNAADAWAKSLDGYLHCPN